VPLANVLVQLPAEDLRPPVVGAREETEDGASEEHIVEVRDHEIAVGLL
jgi:hypothetical protein